MTESLSFEEALSALEDCVTRLESGELSLEETLSVYERGQHLLGVCEDALEQAELTLQTLHQQQSGPQSYEEDQAQT